MLTDNYTVIRLNISLGYKEKKTHLKHRDCFRKQGFTELIQGQSALLQQVPL